MGSYANPLNSNPYASTTNSNPFSGGMPGFGGPYGTTGGGSNPNSPYVADSNPGGNPYLPTQSTPWSPAAGTTQNTGTVGSTNIGSGIIATGLQWPQEASDWEQYVNSQIGQGLPGFNLSTMLPDGTMTQPGQLSASLNPIMQQLMSFFQGKGSNMPGMNTLGDIANNGISALPQWQAMLQAQQQNIGQNQANLKEQYAGMGDLAGSPFATSSANFQEQTTLDQNALLAQLTQQNIGTQIGVGEYLQGQGQQFASGVQSLDQAAIDRMYQQFQTDLPQNNPMNQFAAMLAQQYPPTTKTPTGFQDFMQILGDVMGMGKVTYNAGGGN
jgi:hypothetical protein